MSISTRPSDPSFTAADIDLDLVADELADALDPVDAAALQDLVARDPVARDRYHGFVEALGGLTAVLGAEPLPPLPDEVLIRLDAAIARESSQRAADGASAAARAMAPAGRRFRRGFARWAGGLMGTAAVFGGLVLALHSLGGASSTTGSSSTAAGTAQSGASAAAAASAAPPQMMAGPAATAPVPVTPQTLDTVVRVLVKQVAPLRGTAPGATSETVVPGVAPGSSDRCLPVHVPATTTVVAQQDVIFGGRPATLVVLRRRGAPERRVQAEVFRGCGTAALLARTVTLAP